MKLASANSMIEADEEHVSARNILMGRRDSETSVADYLDRIWAERDRLQGGETKSTGVWPYSPSDGVPVPFPGVMSEACRATLEAVVEKLDPPSNVSRLRSKERKS